METLTKQGMELGEELRVTKLFDLGCMLIKVLPKICFEKQFGVTAVELG